MHSFKYNISIVMINILLLTYAELDPVRSQQSRQDHHKEESSSTGKRSRYMKLKTKEENSSDGYTKPLRARSLDGEF